MDHCYTEAPRVQRGDLELLPEAEAVKLAAIAKAFSDPIRVQIIRLLEQRPDLCTCEFEELLGLSQSKISYHLKILHAAGIVTRETFGTWSHYSLCKQGLLSQIEALNKGV